MAALAPLNPAMHGNTRIREGIDLDRFRPQQVLPVTIYEFAQAGSDCPVLFIRNANNGQFQSVQLMGLAPDNNLMCRGGRWRGNYIPGILQLDPLRLVETAPGSEQLAVAIEPDSPLVSETEGERLFGDDGKPTEFLERRREMLSRYYEHGQITRAFIERIVGLDLLQQRELSVNLQGSETRLGGLFLVDEQKLRELPDKELLEFARNGFLQAIHCHLMSQHQLRNLARLAVADLEPGSDPG